MLILLAESDPEEACSARPVTADPGVTSSVLDMEVEDTPTAVRLKVTLSLRAVKFPLLIVELY